ncbi:MAG: methionine adenosyltransferase [Pseudomonadota bacterium]|nr:methionine adenosyltransferase [Pseudomonadota bacterium]
MSANYHFTSESVSEGHPDKLCDRISDAILDNLLQIESTARVGCETFATTNRVVIGGEIGLRDSRALHSFMSNVDGIVRDCIKDIGYEQEGFHWENVKIENLLHHQSADIALGVDKNGAGDQGIMFGYAIDETAELMPAPIYYSHLILRELSEARKRKMEPALGPDSKSQLTVKYENGKPIGVSCVVLSTQHLDEKLKSADIREIVEPYVLKNLPEGWVDGDTKWHINPTGKFVIGGPDGDTGLTGRKIIVDTYGGAAPHGGGAFSGKDPTKVDRSATYVARYLAKNIVASGLASKCLIQLSYAIGVSEPLSVFVNTFGTCKVSESKIANEIPKLLDLSPNGIINHLGLLKPIYQKTAAYGHFGRRSTAEGEFSWEKLDLVELLKDKFS